MIKSRARDGGRLRDHEVAEQLTAADAVLIALGRSSSDAGAVLATVRRARSGSAGVRGSRSTCCTATSSSTAAAVGLSPEYEHYIAQHPIRRDRDSMAGRVALDRRIHQVTDVLTDPGYGDATSKRSRVTGP